ncbi:hypothetical protein CK203_086945 [Vitis vinifera]|uniref:Uncharacterized protein n=1 Tax=Vitis vinifera TaxID=29760 RepID=A0A438FIU6_VITVI|nr:hypothetical protein CK203_086945 [Vitis vinifera]
MYFMAFAAVVVGLIIYSGGGKGDEQHYAEIADEDAERSRYFDEKAGLLGNSNQSSIVGGSRLVIVVSMVLLPLALQTG